jgi:ubiquinone/menaquinone biosynthesis C-methylase UbiE
MAVVRSAEEIRDVNTRYHDVAASTYDAKWGIDFGPIGQAQVLGKVRKALGASYGARFGRALEIGAGTGYFSLNLVQAGLVREATCTDISPGMVATLNKNAQRLGVKVRSARADAESLPFPAGSFDLVHGHAVLHHLPDLERAFTEFERVLVPGGMIAFAGEPSRIGDQLATIPKRAAAAFAPAWRALLRARAGAISPDGEESGLEHVVDIHAFSPAELVRYALGAGFGEVSVRGEELLAGWFGWFNRGLEATAEADAVPMLWRQYAYHGYLMLQKVDALLLEGRLPAALFYNLLLTARKPA